MNSQPETKTSKRVALVLGATAAIAVILFVRATQTLVPGDGATLPELEPRDTASIAKRGPTEREVSQEEEHQTTETRRRGEAFRQALGGFKGRIVHAGTGVEGAEVAIYRFDVDALWDQKVTLMGPETHAPKLAIGRATTDAAGRFLVTGVWPKSFYLLRASHHDLQASTRGVNRAPGAGEIVDLGDVSLHDGATIVGTVVGPAGRPVSGATVRAAIIPDRLLGIWPVERLDFDTPLLWVNGDSKHAFDLPHWVRERAEELLAVTTKTDAEGRFALAGVPATRVHVLINTAGLVPALQRVEARPGTDLGTICMERGVTARGVVRDAHGAPVANAEVLVGPASAGIPLVFATRVGKTDRVGAFAAAGFSRGFAVAAARAAADSPWVVSNLQTIEREIVLVLPDSHSLTVDVRSKSGRPVAKPRFKVLPSATRLSTIDLALLGMVKPLALEGKVHRLEDGRHRIVGLQQGWYAIQVDAPGHAVSVKTLSLASDTEIEVLLDTLKPFEVRVLDSYGNAVPDTQIFMHGAGEFPRIPRLPLNCGHTDSDGRLRVTQAASNRVAVRAVHPGFAPAEREVDLPIERIDLTLPAPGTIEGVLTEGGKTPPPGKWTLSVRRTHPKPHSMVLPRLHTPDQDGGFRVTGLMAGSYEVSVIAAVGRIGMELAMDTRVFAKQLRSSRRSKRYIPVTAGRTTRIELDTLGDTVATGPTVPVVGTVTVNGRPGVGLEVTGYHKRWLSAKVGTDGSFDLGQVAIGDAGLYVIDPMRARQGGWEMLWWKRVHLAEDSNIRLNIDLQLGALSGVVVQADGLPVRGCMVRANGKTPGPGDKAVFTTLWAATDREGRFRFDRLQAGVYEAQVWESKYGRATVPGIHVSRNHEASVRIELGRVVTVTGRVDMSHFGPQAPQWAWLTLFGLGADGAPRSKEWGAEIRSDGSFQIGPVPPDRYQVQISAMFREATVEPEWDTRTWVDPRPLKVGSQGLTGVSLRPGKLIQKRRENRKKQKRERLAKERKRAEKIKRLRRARLKKALEKKEEQKKEKKEEEAK